MGDGLMGMAYEEAGRQRKEEEARQKAADERKNLAEELAFIERIKERMGYRTCPITCSICKYHQTNNDNAIKCYFNPSLPFPTHTGSTCNCAEQ